MGPEMREVPAWRRFDLLLLVVLGLLIALGVAMIRSATQGTPDLADLWRRQATFALVGLGLFLLAAALPYTWLRHVWWAGYLLALGLLVLVLFTGESEIGNVRRWFSLGPVRLQPSFPAMLFHIVATAAILDLRPRRERRLEMEEEAKPAPPGLVAYLVSGILTLILAGLVFREPDLSTAVIYIITWIAMTFVSGVRLLYLLGASALGLGALIPLWQIMEDYQRERILIFLSPSLDPEKLYNLNQALISIGSGGMWGRGYGTGSQSQLHFLRVRHTDFIFSVVGEELGFVGTALLLGLFCLLTWRVFRAALLARDRFGRLLAVGAGTVVLFPLLVNVGMNVGLLPVTGLPLPFISYGGSALVTYMTAMGLVESVAMRRRER